RPQLQLDNDGREEKAQEHDHEATSLPPGRWGPSGCGTASGGPAAMGFWKAHTRATGQRMPIKMKEVASVPPTTAPKASVAMPTQLAILMAAVCGWSRFLATWPGNDPSVTTTCTPTARIAPNRPMAMMS